MAPDPPRYHEKVLQDRSLLGLWASTGCVPLKLLSRPLPDLQAFVLSSVELQVLTGSCFKLRTVHNIPVTSNKDGECRLGWRVRPCLRMMPGRSCGVPRPERGPCSGTLAVQGDSYPPGGTAGAEPDSRPERSRLQHGAAFGVSPVSPWAGQDQGVPRARPSQPYWNLTQDCPASRRARDIWQG